MGRGERVAGGVVVRVGPGLVLSNCPGILPGSKWTGVCVAEQQGRQLAARQELNREAVGGTIVQAGIGFVMQCPVHHSIRCRRDEQQAC